MWKCDKHENQENGAHFLTHFIKHEKWFHSCGCAEICAESCVSHKISTTVKVVLPSPPRFDLPPLYVFLRHPIVFIGHSRTYIFFLPNIPIVLNPTAMDGRDGEIVGILSATYGHSCATHVFCEKYQSVSVN
jgi:hypothetical protein